jgi:hypothetical protein
MRLFRRSKGRHALGAAVTGIPSGPLPAATLSVPSFPAPVPVPSSAAPVQAAPAPPPPVQVPVPVPAAAVAPVLPQVSLLPQPAVVPASRVQLGFRDGTSAVLDPSSRQAQALEQLAQSLTRKD